MSKNEALRNATSGYVADLIADDNRQRAYALAVEAEQAAGYDPHAESLGKYEGDGNAFDLLNKVRDMGFAVTAFAPEELCGADPRKVEDQMVECGWEIVEMLATEPFPPAMHQAEEGVTK